VTRHGPAQGGLPREPDPGEPALGGPQAAGASGPGEPATAGPAAAGGPQRTASDHASPAVPGSAPALLEVEGLVTRFPVPRGLVGTVARRPRRTVHAVEGVSLAVDDGELVALVGESGCGKTTTAQSILRLVEPEAGTIRFRGEDITHRRQRELRPLRRRMQIIYQDPYESLDPRFRVRQTIEEPLAVHAIGTREERHERVVHALERAGLTPPELFLDRYPHELSGGQRQRVAIAAALVLEPELLVADEPVSMLDVSVRAGILALLDELRRSGLGILMITHDLSTAAHYADRIAVMYLGRIVEEGPARAVVDDPKHPYTRALISVVPSPDPRDRATPQILRGEAPNPVAVPDGCRFHPRCPAAFERCPHDDPRELLSAESEGHRAACWLLERG
jgi:peptide/nickel transport system ATP-binding protein